MKKLGLLGIALLWVLLVGLLAMTGLEYYLHHRNIAKVNSKSNSFYEKLSYQYAPFKIQHINPFYLFFFPYNLEERRRLNNEVCKVSDEGFRGTGPSEKRRRKLAFLLGGSAAFGYYASNDSTTITGYLNNMQDEYLFVNCGVPSWNSTQELYRICMQLIKYKPDFIIVYDGANDIKIPLNYGVKMRKFIYSPGTPESFDKLYELVGDIRRGGVQNTNLFIKVYFPMLEI